MDGEEVRPPILTTNYSDDSGVTNYEIDTYTINTCEWFSETHTLFATAECQSGFGDAPNGGVVASGHAVSPFVPVLFSNLVQEISFSQPSFDPSSGQTQHVSAVFAQNCDWTLTVQDLFSNVVKTATGSGASLQYDWDGTSDGGTNLNPGIYYYYISAGTNGESGDEIVSGGGGTGGSPPSPSSVSGDSTLWTLLPDSDDIVPLAIYPPGFDTNSLTVFSASPDEIESLSPPSSSLDSESGGFSFAAAAGGSLASAQNTPKSPQRKPTNPIVGISGLFGIAYDNPMRYMMEETPFNEDLAGAEHWKIEEPKTSTDIRTRVAFGNAIKECFTNRDFSIHPKGGKALSQRIFRRGTISINDDPELLIVLPPFNGSVDDKLHLFKCAKVTAAFDDFRGEDGTPALLPEEVRNGELDQAALWAHVLTEIPLIRAWLLRAFKTVPMPLRDDRFGVAAYHNAELKQLLVSFAPEIRLLELIDEILFADEPPYSRWEGRAIELEQKLRQSPFAFEAEKALRHMGRLGSYLGKLLRTEPKRVSKRVLEGHTLWTIHPPSRMEKIES